MPRYKRQLWDPNATLARSTFYSWRQRDRAERENVVAEVPEAPDNVYNAPEHDIGAGAEVSDDDSDQMESSENDGEVSDNESSSDASTEGNNGRNSSDDGSSDIVSNNSHSSNDASLSNNTDNDSESSSDSDEDNDEDIWMDAVDEIDEVQEEYVRCPSPQPFGHPPLQQNLNRIEVDNNGERARQPLYEGCPVTAEESSLLIMSFIIRWGLQDKAIEDLLSLMNCHMPYQIMGSKFLFLKQFPTPAYICVRYFCPNCSKLLPRELTNGPCACGHLCNVEDLKHEGTYYIELSISEQIKHIFNDVNLHTLLRKNCTEKDVVEGSVYKDLRNTGVIGDNDLTLQWNTDGVQPFKSSKVSMWPIQACINELPFQARRDNMILCGLYYGKSKPSVNSFLKPFVDELEILHNQGIMCYPPGQNEAINVKVHTIVAAVDSVARAPLQGLKQYNGRQGCSFCLRKGTRIPRGNGFARIYSGGSGALRNIDQHLNALHELHEYNRTHRKKKKSLEGVRYASIVLLIPVFDITSSFSPDFLHSALEGTVKTFLKFWKHSSNEGMDWHLPKRKMTLLNAKLLSIMPCKEITRTPRSVEDIALWKASEFLNFLLYFSVICLKGLLPKKYLNHWFLFVYSITVFLRESFSNADFLKAKAAITKFVIEIPDIYTNCFHLCTFNTHLLLHFPDAVERFGGLWASSTFPFEHYNGILTRLINGPQHVPQQICRSFIRVRQVSAKGSEVFSAANCPQRAKDLFKNLISRYYTSNVSVQHNRDLRLFGTPERYILSLVERVAIQRLLQVNQVDTITKSFRRMIFKGTVYHANHYNSLRVRDNSTVLVNNCFMSIQRILLVRSYGMDEEVCVAIGEKLERINEELCRDREIQITSSSMFHVCRRSGLTVAHFALDILKKCVLVPYDRRVCVVPLVNNIIRD